MGLPDRRERLISAIVPIRDPALLRYRDFRFIYLADYVNCTRGPRGPSNDLITTGKANIDLIT